MNNIRTRFIIILLFFIFTAGNLTIKGEIKEFATDREIQDLISTFKSNNISKIVHFFSYPLPRPYPIPSVKNEIEMKERFSQIADPLLREEIKKSSLQNWSEVGWRGTMLKNGIVWLNSEGKIYAINHTTDFEKKLILYLIKLDKSRIHSSLKKYDSPEYLFQTRRFLVRIDRIGYKYRYASWPKNSSQSTKPSLVIENGSFDVQGTMRNRIYTFRNGSYDYIITNDSLSIEQNGKIIMDEQIEKIFEPFEFKLKNSTNPFHNFD
jgi:hypothetical protein